VGKTLGIRPTCSFAYLPTCPLAAGCVFQQPAEAGRRDWQTHRTRLEPVSPQDLLDENVNRSREQSLELLEGVLLE
jgi:hypothetical protein